MIGFAWPCWVWSASSAQSPVALAFFLATLGADMTINQVGLLRGHRREEPGAISGAIMIGNFGSFVRLIAFRTYRVMERGRYFVTPQS